MNPFSTPDAGERLGIYLDDHRALIAGELALADRCRRSNEGTELAHQLTVHIGTVTTDRSIIDQVLTHLDRRIDHVKAMAAALGERIGRFKPNGQLTGQSPLSPVVELEGLIAATHARQVMWTALDECDALTPFATGGSVSERADVAAEQLDVLRSFHHEAIAHAVASPDAGQR